MDISTTTMQLVALSRAGYQDPSIDLGIRCVQGDLPATRGQVRPMTDTVAAFPVRIRPFATLEGSVPPGGTRQT